MSEELDDFYKNYYQKTQYTGAMGVFHNFYHIVNWETVQRTDMDWGMDSGMGGSQFQEEVHR